MQGSWQVSEASAEFLPSGVITLTTDFGLTDPFVGVMKGQVLTRFGQARLVDLTHEIEAHWPAEAGFWLARAFRYFPVGTVHVAVVDPGVGSSRAIAAVEGDGHVFLAPDNGLLAPVMDALRVPVARQVTDEVLRTIGIGSVSATFHGRDIFAPLAAEIAAGRLAPGALGPQSTELVPGWLEAPVVAAGQINGSVVTIDHFGNLITNVEASHLRELHEAVVRVGGHELPLRRTYTDVRPGDYLALLNSFGVLEVARAERSAAEGLGLARGAPVIVFSKRA
jgi:S-adenosyl-L-methionine hydrolase (adenosine-forming)